MGELPHLTIICENSRSVSLVSEHSLLATDKSLLYQMAGFIWPSLLSNVLLKWPGQVVFLNPHLDLGFVCGQLKFPTGCLTGALGLRHTLQRLDVRAWVQSLRFFFFFFRTVW